MKIIEKLKTRYIRHRLKLSEELSHAIYMWYKVQIREWTEQIEKLDNIIKIIFNK